jgi:3-hydroxymyristoyl/3-hydroxydecanoyl-(acyl carrier protein) dehydratase
MKSFVEQLRAMLKTEPREGGFRSVFQVDKDFALFPDHFPQLPILPGICIAQAVLLSAAQALDVPVLRLCVLKRAKLMQPVRPGDTIEISADLARLDDGTYSVKATLLSKGTRCAEISLIARRNEDKREAAI